MSHTTLALIVVIAALGLTALVQIEKAVNEFDTTPPVPAPYQVGDSLETLVASVGLPDDISFGLDTMSWYYGGEKGQRIDIHDDILISIDGTLPTDRARILPDDKQPRLGQSAAATARLLGNPTECYSGQFGSQYNYPNGWSVTYRFGRVVACRKGP